jgi:CheY-like chemotaxis protein
MSGTSPMRPPSGTRSRVGRVLVVDDDAQALTAIVAALSGPYEIVACQDPAEAVARMAAGARFDVVLYDLTMRGMTGAELFARVCAISTRQAGRIVFLGGGTMPLGLAEFLSRVSNQCLQRPMDLQVLRALVFRRVAEEQAREGPGSAKTG